MKAKILVLVVLLVVLVSATESRCRYRNLNLPKEIFAYWASWGCYSYTRPDFFDDEPLKASYCSLYVKDVTYIVPGLQQGIFCHPFHYTNAWIVEEVETSFWSNRSVTRWIECSKEAEQCCANVMDADHIVGERCPSVWDGWSCFQSIPAGQNYKVLCPRYAYGYEPPHCHHYGYKACYRNATWKERTDYSPCDVTPPLIARNKYYISILSLSTVFCIPALLVLIFTKAAQSQKLRIIRTLLLFICIHNVMVILVRVLIIIPELTTSRPTTTVMHRNTAGCRALTALEKLTGNCVFASMLLIAIFLHRLLTNLLQIHDRNRGVGMLPFYIAAGALAVGSAIGWVVIMATEHNHNCWQVSDEGHVDWILDGPRLAMLFVNLVLLLHITVRLWNVFNAKDSDENPFLRALKAALICLPVFGMQFLFLIIRPDMDNCGTEQFYYIINYTIAGAQGIFIAIFHCYTERDVCRHFVAWWHAISGLWRKEPVVMRRSPTETTRDLVGHVASPQMVNHQRGSADTQTTQRGSTNTQT